MFNFGYSFKLPPMNVYIYIGDKAQYVEGFRKNHFYGGLYDCHFITCYNQPSYYVGIL